MEDINYFLTSGDKTKIDEKVQKLASCIQAKSSTDTIREIMYLMNKKIHRLVYRDYLEKNNEREQ